MYTTAKVPLTTKQLTTKQPLNVKCHIKKPNSNLIDYLRTCEWLLTAWRPIGHIHAYQLSIQKQFQETRHALVLSWYTLVNGNMDNMIFHDSSMTSNCGISKYT